LVRELFDRFLPVEQRRKVLGDPFNPQVVLSLTGDPARGRTLFHAEGGVSCSRCHALEGQGRAYGPDLSLAAKKYRTAELLDHIIYPNRSIAPEFVLHQVELRSGDVVNGFVLRRSAEGLVLRSEDLTERTLKNSEIASDVASSLSAMPDGLLSGLTAQEAADVLSYLMSVPQKP
jgi:putative heme-binding domain-containing protein